MSARFPLWSRVGAILAGALLISSAGAGPASAAPPAGPRPLGGAVVRPASAGITGCFTQFDPTNPNGAPMTQRYANCTGGSVEVCPAAIINGAYHVGENDAYPLGPDSWVEWQWSSTTRGATYTTVFCDANGEYSGSSDGGFFPRPAACFTSFSNNVPNGAAVFQYYNNCAGSAVEVLPAYSLGGVLHVAPDGCAPIDQSCTPQILVPGVAERWYWPSTVPGASYTTIFADQDNVQVSASYP